MDSSQKAKFELWKAELDYHLQSMVKKSSGEFKIKRDLAEDFLNNVAPIYVAERIIKHAYQK